MKRLTRYAWILAAVPDIAMAGDVIVVAPPAAIELAGRQSQAVPCRVGCTHTGGGNIDVQQPAPDTLIVTMSGIAVAVPHPCKNSMAGLSFDLSQDFDITFARPETKRAKLTIEGRVIGLLRSHKCGGGSASISCPAHALVTPCNVNGPTTNFLEVAMPGRGVACGENLSINDRVGPVLVNVPAARFTLHQTFGIQAVHPCSLLPCKASSAEFAPDPALDPLWISYWEPFHGAIKKDFGFQVVLRVSPE